MLDESLVSFDCRIAGLPDCRIAQAHEVGSHTIFYCEVLKAGNGERSWKSMIDKFLK
ncbi:flavin reductase family protein [Pseudomonas sp. PAMC 29040]|uniref:flavin reductase family protein n=1 Tax=Pseudomonas sp. PAMC 29040 TaxID=2498450 RepID=UPI0021156DD5|nr:flavin reductase family protein [Pseudomonas sp. PAMC 29040]